jgi:hypothetical protein
MRKVLRAKFKLKPKTEVSMVIFTLKSEIRALEKEEEYSTTEKIHLFTLSHVKFIGGNWYSIEFLLPPKLPTSITGELFSIHNVLNVKFLINRGLDKEFHIPVEIVHCVEDIEIDVDIDNYP